MNTTDTDRVFVYKTTADSQAMRDMQTRIEQSLLPHSTDKWTLTSSLYISKQSTDARELFSITFDDVPKKCFLMLKNVILEAETGMLGILDKIKSYQLRQTINVTVMNSELKFSPTSREQSIMWVISL